MPIKKEKLDAIKGYREYQARKEKEKEEQITGSSPSKNTSTGRTEKQTTQTTVSTQKKAVVKKEKLDSIQGYREWQANRVEKEAATTSKNRVSDSRRSRDGYVSKTTTRTQKYDRPVYTRETAERMAESVTNAETALTKKLASGVDITTEVERRSKSIENQVKSLKNLEGIFNRNPSEANAQKYNAAYEQYVKDVEDYNNLYNEYKALYDAYTTAYDDYTNYMDTAKSDASFLDVAGNAIGKGITGAGHAFASTLDFLLPTEFLGKYDYPSKWNEGTKAEYEDYSNRLAESLYGKGKVAETAAEIGASTVQAAPNAILALLSGFTSVGAQGAAAIGTAANTGLATTIPTGIKTMAKNPMYWSSFAQTLGTDYEENIENGASTIEAVASAIISSALNAGVEIGGGIETLPDAVRNGGSSAVKEWVKSMLDEGKEEVIQDIISGITQKSMYDHDKTWFSTTDEDAVVNPVVLAKDFGMGAAVGGILGGAQTGVVSGMNALTDYANKRIAQTNAQQTVQPVKPIQQEVTEENQYTLEDAARDAVAAREAQAQEVTQEQTATQQDVSDILTRLSKGERIDNSTIPNDQFYTIAEREDTGVDALGRVYQMDPSQHISQRTPAEVSKRGINAFQFDHPELQPYYKQAAQQLLDDAALSLDAPKTTYTQRGMQGKRLVSEILDTPSLRSAMDMGLSRTDIIKAADDLIADKGQENNAAAKRLEIVLDEMLTNGYTTARGEQVEANQKYIRLKENLLGYQPRVAEDLPLYAPSEHVQETSPVASVSTPTTSDMTVSDVMAAASERAVKAAYEAGKANVPRERANLETDEQITAYEQGRRDAILEKQPEPVEKPISEEYTGGEVIDQTDRISKEDNNGQGERSSKVQGSHAGTPAENADRHRVQKESRGVAEEDGRSVRLDERIQARGKLVTSAKEYGTSAEFVEADKWPSKHAKHIAFSRDGKIYIRDNFPLGKVDELIPHEGTHIMRQNNFKPYLDFLDRTPDMLDLSSDDGKALLEAAAKHRGIDLFAEMSEKDRTTLYDEVNALVSGILMNDKISIVQDNLNNAFKDFQAYREELAGIHQQYKNAVNGGETQVRGQDGVTPQRKIADVVIKYIQNGKDFSADRLFKIADAAYGGTMAEGAYTVKDAYDGMELAVNRYLMNADFVKQGNGDVVTANKTLNKLIEMLRLIPTQTKRTAEMESFQQFSTPPNIAYLAAWSANVDASDVVLEPSAGIGGLALWPKAWGATVYANELSERRLAFLNELGLDGTFNLNAEQIDNLLPDNIKPSVVIMNPPFSATAGRTNKNSTANAKRHIEQALDRLEDGGRLVAILGNGMADDAPAFRSWWNDLRKEYNVRANIRLDGQNYRKYGTTFDVQMVVIDKTGPTTTETKTGTFKNLADIPAFMEEIRNDRTRVSETDPDVNQRIPGVRVEHGVDTGVRSQDETGNRVREGMDGQRASGRAVNEPGNAGEIRGRVRDGRPSGSRVETGTSDEDGQQRVRGRRGSAGSSGRVDGAGTVKLQRNGESVTAAAEVSDNPDSVYSTYSPRKVHIEGAKKHPAKLVESAAMAAVEPPDVTYTPSLPSELATSGKLSDAQFENIVYAGQAHEQMLQNGTRKGYFIGDGTGVGKGRQLAGIILDNFMQGRERAIWVSDKAELINDAVRDWVDLGGKKEDILNFSKYKLGQDITADRGIMFMSYDTLKSKKGTMSRLADIGRWLDKDFDGVICLDEAHNMANSEGKQGTRGKSKPSQKALAGIELQKMFPKARVVYASATGATDVSDYAYLDRLGLWGPGTAFNNSTDFMSKISAGGLAAMELVARDMKAMGVYMARSISYDDVTYDTIQHDLNPMQTEIYDTMSRAWQTIFQNVNSALGETFGSLNKDAKSAAWSAFYVYQQRFYNQILTSMSMPSVIENMRSELANGRSCVLQIVNTNESQQERAISAMEDQGLTPDDLDLTPREGLVSYLMNSFPVQQYEEYTDEKGNKLSRPVVDKDGKPVLSKRAVKQRDALVSQIQQMSVPDGPLEMLFNEFGPDQVAEVTGRKRRVVEKVDENGERHRTIEKISEKAGIADAQMFQDGKKRILIFSDKGGTGRSYHADLRAKNQQQRVHYLVQAGWNASKATQGFGRTHRSNQASAPIFRLVSTNVMGQKRFISTIARRLDQLGALTKGQRQAGSGVFSEKDNLENPIAQDALMQYYREVPVEILKKIGLYEKLYDKRTGAFKTKDNDTARNIGMFLNRILSLEVEEQNQVFQGFYDTFDRMMDVAIQNGTVDMGLENYRADKIEVKDEKVIRKDSSGADTKYVQMTAYRKPELVSLTDIKKSGQNFQGLVRLEDGSVRAVFEISSKTNPRTGEIQKRFKLESPVRGKSSVYVEDTMKAKTTAIDKPDWAKAWKEETAKAPEYTESTLHLLTGTLLPIWNRLPENNTRVMRVVSSDGKQYLGRVIRADQIDSVLKGLGANRTMQTYTPQQINDAVLTQGKEVLLRDNRWKITRRRVSGEWRMEVTGQNTWYLQRQYPGIITERINYDYRYFIPTGEKGNSILAEIMKNNPVVDVREQAQTGDVDQMIGDRTADYSDEWTAKRVGDTNKTPKRLSEIIEQIRHDFGLNITTGHIRGSDTRGQYNRRDNGIRSRIANDLPVVAHELGHHFDQVYDLQGGMTDDMKRELLDKLDPDLAKRYSKKKLVGEGIAEYVRKFLQNREVAAIDYPQFHNYFMSQFTGKDLALIEDLADEVNAYYSLDADTATSSIRLREEGGPDARTFSEKIKDKASVLYQAWADSNEGIKRFDRATGSNTYKLASNAAYSDAMAGQIIMGDLTDANGQYVAPGLKTALHGLNMKDKNEYRLFGEYLTVKHGPERLAEGMRIFADDRKNSTKWMNARQAELEAQYPKFAEISDRLYQFQKDFLKTWGVDTGLVAQESADEWAERWSYYVPFNRAVSEDKRGGGAKRGFANQNSTIKKARGSGLEIIHPVDNIVTNIVKMVNAGVRNNVMRTITDAALTMDADAVFIEKVPTPMVRKGFNTIGVKQQLTEWLEQSSLTEIDKSQATGIVNGLDDILFQYGRGKAFGDVVTVMKEGKPEFWKVNDPQLLTSVTNMSQPQMHGILDAYGRISRFMTSNITGNNVVWSIFSNAPRDAMTFFTYSKNKNVAKMAVGVGSAYVNKAKGDNASPLYKEYLAMGGGSESMYSADSDLAKKARKKLAGKNISLNPLDWISFVSDTVESGPRFATYKLMREAGMTPQEAFYEATDITVNFRRGGTMARQLNRLVPFFNANVQGLDKFRRWITAEDAVGKNRKKVVAGRTISYLVASVALASLVYGINNGDDDKEKEYQQLSSFTKNSYWNIPIGDGKFFAIPKPREIAVLSSFFERCLELNVGENDHAFDEFYVYATDNFFPAIASDLLQAPVNGAKETMGSILGNFGLIGAFGYVSANRDFLGRPIVSSSLQNLEAKDQYTERTSKIAYWIGQAFDESPAMIDYFFEQVLGGWWKYQKALFPVGEDKRDLSLGVRNTYIKDSQYSTDLTNWMYDKADASSKAKKSDPANMDKAIEARLDSNMTNFYGSYYKLAKNKTETELTRMTRQLVLDMIREYQKGVDNGTTTAMQEAVNKVCKSMNSTDYLPSVMSVDVKDGNDVKHTLSDTQYVEYQTDYLRIYWETVENTLNTYASAEDQAYVLTSAKKVAKEQATARALARIGAPKTKFTTQYGDMTSEELTTWFAKMDKANEDNKTTPAEKAAAIDSIKSLSDIDISNLWDTKEGYAAYEGGVDMRAYVDYLGAGGSVNTEKLIGAKDFGMSEEEYFNFLETLKEFDQPTASGKYGTYTQDEATAAIASIPGLSRDQRSYLWQSVNKNWKPKNNPWR